MSLRAAINQALAGDPDDLSERMDRVLRTPRLRRCCDAWAAVADAASRATVERHERLVPPARVLGPLP